MIVAMIPEYMEGSGDCCRIRTTEGETKVSKRIDTVVRELFDERLMSYTLIRRRTAEVLKQRTLVPLYLSPLEVLIPFKVRERLVKGDPCHGYVNIHVLERIHNGELTLLDGTRIGYLETKRVLQRRELFAWVLKDRLFDKKADSEEAFRTYLSRLKQLELESRERRGKRLHTEMKSTPGNCPRCCACYKEDGLENR